jgi:CTP:phosphocholine cytidylyltransferase-like protein
MSNRFTAPAKRSFKTEDFSVILIHTDKIKNKSLALSRVNGSTLIESQIKSIRGVFGEAVDIIVVSGFDSEGLTKVLKRNIRVVVNNEWEVTDFSYSINLGLLACQTGAYIFDGTAMINPKTLKPKLESHFYIDHSLESELGYIENNGRIVNFAYGLENRLGHNFFFAKREADLYCDTLSCRKDIVFHEVLNRMMDCNQSEFYAI